jgi:hypothetical protein
MDGSKAWAVPFSGSDPYDVVYRAGVSCARCGETNQLLPRNGMFLCRWCARGEMLPENERRAAAHVTAAPRRRIQRRIGSRVRRAA